ncbi:hypothetical protein LINPERHAP2_LOCUS15800 [Linum perenne]
MRTRSAGIMMMMIGDQLQAVSAADVDPKCYKKCVSDCTKNGGNKNFCVVHCAVLCEDPPSAADPNAQLN